MTIFRSSIRRTSFPTYRHLCHLCASRSALGPSRNKPLIPSVFPARAIGGAPGRRSFLAHMAAHSARAAAALGRMRRAPLRSRGDRPGAGRCDSRAALHRRELSGRSTGSLPGPRRTLRAGGDHHGRAPRRQGDARLRNDRPLRRVAGPELRLRLPKGREHAPLSNKLGGRGQISPPRPLTSYAHPGALQHRLC